MTPPRILLVDDNEHGITTLTAILVANNFEVTPALSVNSALHCIATAEFDVLVTDLNLPNTGDGFTVVSAMRHTNPKTITIVLSVFPDVSRTMAATLLQADEILLRPLDIPKLIDCIEDRLLNRVSRVMRRIMPVADILERESYATIEDWVERAGNSPDLQWVKLHKQERIEHLPMIFAALIDRLRHPRKLEEPAPHSQPAHDHGCLRWQQGYTMEMLLEESRMLQVSIFQTLQNNLSTLDFSLVLVDVMTIADEVDTQLRQQVASFMAAQQIAECHTSGMTLRA